MTQENIRLLLEKLDATSILIVGLMFLLWTSLNGIKRPLENINKELGILIAAIRDLKRGG